MSNPDFGDYIEPRLSPGIRPGARKGFDVYIKSEIGDNDGPGTPEQYS